MREEWRSLWDRSHALQSAPRSLLSALRSAPALSGTVQPPRAMQQRKGEEHGHGYSATATNAAAAQSDARFETLRLSRDSAASERSRRMERGAAKDDTYAHPLSLCSPTQPSPSLRSRDGIEISKKPSRAEIEGLRSVFDSTEGVRSPATVLRIISANERCDRTTRAPHCSLGCVCALVLWAERAEERIG